MKTLTVVHCGTLYVQRLLSSNLFSQMSILFLQILHKAGCMQIIFITDSALFILTGTFLLNGRHY